MAAGEGGGVQLKNCFLRTTYDPFSSFGASIFHPPHGGARPPWGMKIIENGQCLRKK